MPWAPRCPHVRSKGPRLKGPCPSVDPAEASWNSRTTSAASSARSCDTSGEAVTFCWMRHNAHRLPSRADRRRSSAIESRRGGAAMGS